MDPSLDWDKSFVSPSSKKKTKATSEDRATFWNASSLAYIHHGNIHIKISLSERERILQSQAPPNWMNNNVASTSTKSNPLTNCSDKVADKTKRPKLSSQVEPAVEMNYPDQCGICSESIDIWGELHDTYAFFAYPEAA
jgi:hypothetical protein